MANTAATRVAAGKRSGAGGRAPGAAKPLYAQVEEIIRQRLIDNYWKPGAVLPSEIQLAAELVDGI